MPADGLPRRWRDPGDDRAPVVQRSPAASLTDALPTGVRRQARWAVESLQHRSALRRWQRLVSRRSLRHRTAGLRAGGLAVTAGALAVAVPVPGGPDALLLTAAAGSAVFAAKVARDARRPLQLPPRPVGPVPLRSVAAPLTHRLEEQEVALGRLLEQVRGLDPGCRPDVAQAAAAAGDLSRSLRQRASAVAELERVSAVVPVSEAGAVAASLDHLCVAFCADLDVHAGLVAAAAELAAAAAAEAGDPSCHLGVRDPMLEAVQRLRTRAEGVEVAARAGR